MLTHETIRKFFEEEKASQKLVRLPESFMKDVNEYIESKEKLMRDDQWELDSIKRRLKTIFELRERKIVNLALSYVRTREDPENLLPHEETFFKDIVANIRKFQEDRDKNIEEEAPTVLMNFTKDVDVFVGTDMKNYGPFRQCDIANVPEMNAKVLEDKELAKKADLSN